MRPCKHETGATRHILYNQTSFCNYVKFDSPLVGKGFRTNLSTSALGKGTIIPKSTHDGKTHTFSIPNILHVPTAHCNLTSGSRLDKKGVRTLVGSGKIVYFTQEYGAFATG
jgi:hypothetical protein